MLDREAVFSALFERIRAVPGIKTSGRRLRHMADVPASEQPALFLAQTYQRASYAEGRTIVWNLGANLYLYVRDPRNKTPGVIMNPIMDALMAKFAPDNPMANACTLGGLVWHVQVNSVSTDEGTMDEQAFALIELDIRVPGSPI